MIFCCPASGILLPAWPLLGRRLCFTLPAGLAPENHARQEIPGNCRALLRRNGKRDAWAARSGPSANDWICRGLAVLKALAVPVAQHGPGKKHLRPIRLEPWQEALVNQATEEFIRGLIDSDGCRVVANDPRCQKRALSLLEPVRRHPRPVHRGTRPHGYPVDAAEHVRHRRVPQGGGGAPRGIRRTQIVSGTVKGCPLRVVAGRR